MEKTIWIIEDRREEILDLQRKINAHGGMKAMCILSAVVLNKIIEERINNPNVQERPSLIVISYNMVLKDESILYLIKNNQKIAGVPMFFIIDEQEQSVIGECYNKGAMLVLEKPLDDYGITRIEQASWQYEMSKTYERILLRQNSEIEAAKEIKKLNLQLDNRNQFLHKVFGKYFSDEVLKIILDKDEDKLIGGERREMAILFSDLRGFTSISEKMSADKVTDLLNCYFGTMSKIIMQYSGTIIEYMGDGILAVFGAPIKSDNYHANAISAAITMQNAMDRVNAYCEQMGYSRLKMGIGIHCGEGFIGNVGSEDMMRYNVMGSVVNVCSRVESCCVGGQVMASMDVVRKAKVDVHILDDTYIHAKGVSGMLNVCSITGIDGEYKCYLNVPEAEAVYRPIIGMEMSVYKIDNKIIKQEEICCTLKEISKDIIVASLKGKDNRQLLLFNDAEIRIKDDYEAEGYVKAFGKVKGINENSVKFTLTRMDEDFDRLLGRVRNGEYDRESKWRPMMEKIEIYIMNVELDNLVSEDYFEKINKKYILAWAEEEENIQLAFYSNDNYIRALEFMDYLTGEYGVAKGDKKYANSIIPKPFIEVMKNDKETADLNELFERKADEYIEECECIFANEYIKHEKENIDKMKEYIKREVPWAYVKTTDIVSSGEKFKLKSLENESNIVFTASDDLYIMIGCRGEIYNISRDKFISTYDITDQPFDIFTQMPEYIPEVEKYSDKTYITLDDKAYLCYPKCDKSILAKKINRRTKVFSTHNKGEYFVGRPGDYLALRTDDLSDVYIIKSDIFEQTYEAIK